jgi:hypothetical protein
VRPANPQNGARQPAEQASHQPDEPPRHFSRNQRA